MAIPIITAALGGRGIVVHPLQEQGVRDVVRLRITKWDRLLHVVRGESFHVISGGEELNTVRGGFDIVVPRYMPLEALRDYIRQHLLDNLGCNGFWGRLSGDIANRGYLMWRGGRGFLIEVDLIIVHNYPLEPPRLEAEMVPPPSPDAVSSSEEDEAPLSPDASAAPPPSGETATGDVLERMMEETGVGGNNMGGADGGVSDTCAICLEELSVAKSVVRLRCLHTFHKSCMLGWLTRRNSCPLCRLPPLEG